MKYSVSTNDFKKALAGRKPGPLGRYEYYAVLAPLVEQDGELYLLYEVRSERLRRQPGEVSFPGGMMEEGETAARCAVRETTEELGVSAADIELIGELDYVHTYSNFTMFSFLGTLEADAWSAQSLNRDEVKEVFLVPVSFFLETDPFIYQYEVAPKIGEDFPYEMIKFKKGYNWRKGRTTVPIYTWQDHVIWGLTARITLNLMEILKESMNW